MPASALRRGPAARTEVGTVVRRIAPIAATSASIAATRASIATTPATLALALALCFSPGGAVAGEARAVGAPPVARATGAASPADATDPATLPPALLEALSAAGLTGRGERVAAFDWTLEIRRPARGPRQIRERFAGSQPGLPLGLSPVLHETLSPRPRGPHQGVSVRGLTVLYPGDTVADVSVAELSLPLAPGARFRLDYAEDGASLSQACVVGASVPASSVHPAMPGNAWSIECSGRGRYHGIPVQAGATVLYFVRLGVFLEVEQRIDSPLGRLRGGTRVVSFEMAKP